MDLSLGISDTELAQRSLLTFVALYWDLVVIGSVNPALSPHASLLYYYVIYELHVHHVFIITSYTSYMCIMSLLLRHIRVTCASRLYYYVIYELHAHHVCIITSYTSYMCITSLLLHDTSLPNQPHLLNKYQISMGFSEFRWIGFLSAINILAPYQIDVVKRCGFRHLGFRYGKIISFLYWLFFYQLIMILEDGSYNFI